MACIFIISCSKLDRNIDGFNNAPPLDPFKTKTFDRLSFYYPDKNKIRLASEERFLSYTNKMLEEVLINELLKGPRNKEMIRIIPEKTKLLSVKTIGEVTYVNFSKHIQSKDVSEKDEAFIVYSIVNTLSQLSNVNSIQILIDGEIKEVLCNHYKINRPIKASKLITNSIYKSPIRIVYEFYNTIKNKDDLKMKTLYYDAKSIDFKTLFADTINIYRNMIDYEIIDYQISSYEKYLTLKAKVEIIDKNNSLTRRYEEIFYIIYTPSGFKIDKVLVSKKSVD